MDDDTAVRQWAFQIAYESANPGTRWEAIMRAADKIANYALTGKISEES